MALVKRQILDFNRYEFKYVLSKQLRHEVEKELGHFVELDPFVESVPGHRYVVRSLYFDDANYTAFHDKIDGLRTRSKFRIRTYTTTPDKTVPQFLEQKGRHDNRVFKNRVALAPPLLNETDGDTEAIVRQLDVADSSDKVVKRFQYERFRKDIRSIVLIDYLRRPYFSKYDSEFRITLDEQLRAGRSHELFPSPLYKSYPVKLGYTVMEVKFSRHIPAWFHRIIQSYELRRVSVSKICEGMKVLGMATDLA